MASAADRTLGQIAEDVLGEALVEIVGRAKAAGFTVRQLRLDSRLYLDTYGDTHPGITSAAEYIDERK